MVRYRVVGALLCAGTVLAAPALALAETAEEAVAYTVMGLADGAHFERGKSVMDWREVSASPAVFAADATIAGKPVKFEFSISATDPCNYEVMLEGPMVPGGGKTLYARVDLTAVEGLGISDDALRIEVTGDGFCETGQTNRDCMVIDRSDLFGTVDPTRHAALYEYLRTDVCPAEGAAE